jgi:exopolysaccharide biosynthesis polyprenyl glycosylphosphotransferase
LLAPANGAQLDELEARFAASPGFDVVTLPPSEEGFDTPSDPTPTLPTFPLRTTRSLSAPTSPDSPDPRPVGPVPRVRFRAWSGRYVATLAAADVVIGALAAAVPSLFSNSLNHQPTIVAALAVVGAVVWPLAIGLARGYIKYRVGVGSEELRAVLRAGVGVVVAGAFPAGLLAQQTLLTLVVVGVPFAVLLSTATRFAARKALHHRQGKGMSVRHVVVVGSAAAARELHERLEGETHCGMKVVGACLPKHEIGTVVDLGMPILGNLSEVGEVVKAMDCDAVAVTSDDATRYNYLRKLAWSLEGTGIEMLVDPGLVEVAGPRMHIRPLMGAPLLHIEEPHFSGWRKLLKRTSDVLLTSVGLLAISPVLIGIAVAVKLQDGGPVLFKQKRVGKGGEEFWMYKFRSMVVDAEARKAALMARNEGKGGLFKLGDDPRITRLGHFLRDFSLDELPQLFNVLNGTMSLVGPRPHLAHELAQMPSEASRRALVTPGLTGLWQVSGRSDLEGDDAVRLDLRYVENWTFTLDMLIMWKTASAVLAKRGAR